MLQHPHIIFLSTFTAELGIFGWLLNFEGHKGQYFRVASGLPDPGGRDRGTGCGYVNGGLPDHICIPSRVRGTCLRAKTSFRCWLTWDPFIMYNCVATSQPLWSGSSIERIGLPTTNVSKFKRCH